jgi:hypothetical protein
MRGRGEFAGSQLMSTAVHRSPNKLWRSNSIFDIRGQSIPDLVCVVIADAKPVHSLWFASSSWAKEFKKWSKRLCLTGIDPGYYRKTPRFFKNEIILTMPSSRSKGIRHGGGGANLRCPVSTTVHFSLRNEGSSEYIRVWEGRESLSPNFQTFRDPRLQFHGIDSLNILWGLWTKLE